MAIVFYLTYVVMMTICTIILYDHQVFSLWLLYTIMIMVIGFLTRG